MNRLLYASLPVLLALVGCRPTQLAGESVGQFRVVATLQDNTCGDGYPVQSSTTFYVELRSQPESTYGYWKLPDAPLVSGLLRPDGEFRFTDSQQVTGVQADPTTGTVGCDLQREEVVAGTFDPTAADDAGATVQDAANGQDAGVGDAGPQGSLRGTTTVRITPVTGGDCSSLIQPAGGGFPVLPCEITLNLDGERLATPLF